jgi:hypothetical protein
MRQYNDCPIDWQETERFQLWNFDQVWLGSGDESKTLWYTHLLFQGSGVLGETRAKRGDQRTRTVGEDWLAWIPNEMSQLFEATRKELETSNFILSMIVDEALQLCKEGQRETLCDRVVVFAGLFDRLAVRVTQVIRTIREHGSHFGTLPNVEPLCAANFRGSTAQRVSRTDSLLAKVVFGHRSRFFHKLYAIDEIVGELQREMRAVIAGVEEDDSDLQDQTWQLLEVLGYDISTCTEEAKILLKSFFCALPPEELGAFREKLVHRFPFSSGATPEGIQSFETW